MPTIKSNKVTTSVSALNDNSNTPEIDAEWIKFMTRINRKMNCDTIDDDTISDDDDDSIVSDAIVVPTVSVGSAISVIPISANNVDVSLEPTSKVGNSNIKTKKSCISKKTQRRSYSFIDESTPVTTSELNTQIVDSLHIEIPTTISTISNIRKKFTPIYISTKTKIAYLNQPVDIYDIFWKIPVQHYYTRAEGVIKKQIKFQTTDPAVVASIKEKLQGQPRCYDEFIIEHIDNPTGRIPYKDQRKVSIGLCKKDLAGGSHKKKRAFFNCFVVILRINGGIASLHERAPEDDILYKEMHVKVFNTGKLEIPGIQEDTMLIKVLELLVLVLRPLLGDELDYIRNRCETALINSNFNCGFYIDRDKLFQLLKYKYRMNCNYDSCSYPGIQSKFYYIPDKPHNEQNGQQPVLMSMPYYEVSFMIFRTGSILIVGKCNEDILHTIYRFICMILETEYSAIQMGDILAMGGSSTVNGMSPQIEPKESKISRKKKINTSDIRFYE
jgi:flagellar basal body rod protein FlgB